MLISISLCTLTKANPTNISCPVLFLKKGLRRYKVENIFPDVDVDTDKVSNTVNKYKIDGKKSGLLWNNALR